MGLFGCHVSISGGVEKSPARARDYHCEAMQIFTANQRRWKSKPLSSDSIDGFKSQVTENQIQEVVTHDNYLINLANPEKEKRERSIQALIDEVNRSGILGIPRIVLHPGSHLGEGEEQGIQLIAESLDIIIQNADHILPRLILETTAGQGNYIGYKFEHLRDIIALSSYSDRLGVCFDTCHAFAAGYNIIDQENYMETLQEFDDIIGLDKLEVFHLNGSKVECGSKKDRHCNLGEGNLGWDPFFRLVQDERFENVPMLLETPDSTKYRTEIDKLKEIRD